MQGGNPNIIGSFTSTGADVILNVPQGVDWIFVANQTQLAANQTTAVGVKYYWQSTMAAGSMNATFKSNAANAANLEQYITSGGFTPVNTSLRTPGTSVALTAVSTASTPLVSTGDTSQLTANSSVVRLYNVTSAQQLGGFDFTIGTVVASTSFTLKYMAQLSVAGTTGTYRVIPYDPLFYPPYRYITAITQATQAVVTMSVTHGYQVGQEVRLNVPSAYGMVEMDTLTGTIQAIDTVNNTITLDINSTAFTAFAFPLTGAVPFAPAIVTPVGANTAVILSNSGNILNDSMYNTGLIGIRLSGGAGHPAGASSDVIHWFAGTAQAYTNNNGY